MAEGNGETVNVRTCSICIEEFKDPRLLPCFHTFCLECLHHLTSDIAAGEHFPCPVCRHEVLLPGSGPPGFQTNFYIEADQTRRKFKEAVCEICSKHATWRCNHCVQSLCESCARVHGNLSSSKAHPLIRLQEAATYCAAVSNPEFCNKHSNEVLRFHCQKCQKPICRDCKMTAHEGHLTVDLEDVVDEGRKALEKMKLDFVGLEIVLKKEGVNVKERMKTFSNLVEEITKKIDQDADEHISQINTARKSCKIELEKQHLSTTNYLKTTEKKNNEDMLFLDSHIGYISTLLTEGCGADIMKAVPDMTQRLEKAKTESTKPDCCRLLKIYKKQIEICTYSCDHPALLSVIEPVPMKPSWKFQCASDGSTPDFISTLQNNQAWVAIKGRYGNCYLRLFTKSGQKLKEFVIPKDVYLSRRTGGILELMPGSDTEEKCEEIDGFRNDIKRKHRPQTETQNDMTCTVDIHRKCVKVEDESGNTQLELSGATEFTPIDACWGPNDNLVIVDKGSNSLLLYRKDAPNLRSYVYKGHGSFRPCAVAWDGETRLWVGDLSGRVFVCRFQCLGE